MNPNMAQSLSWDHIREARQQATEARRAGAPRAPAREERMMTTRTNIFTRAARRTLGLFAEINHAQRRWYEIMADPKGE